MKSSPQELARLDKKHIWHPFTQMAEWEAQEPIIIESGDGVWLKDVQGRRYIDGVSSLWVTVHGHRNKVLDAAVKKQLGKIAHSTFLGLTHEPAIALAKKLIDIAPKGLSRVFYSDNGSTAVEVALKMAYQYSQLTGRTSKKKFMAIRNAYHGDTLGSVSVGGIDIFHKRFGDLLLETIPATLENVEEILRQRHPEIVAVVLEPLVQAAAGMLVMPRGFLGHLAKTCQRLNVLFIADEVATGFGRTGTMFACEQEDVTPDFLCVAKGLTGGYLPLAATVTKEKIYQAFLGRYEEYKTFFHGHTYTANPLACAVAAANLELFQKTQLLKKLASKIEYLQERLQKLSTLPVVGETRQAGFMAGIELVKNQHPKRFYPPEDRMGAKVCLEARAHGVLLRPLGDVLVIMPPLVISQNLLAKMMDAIEESIEKVLLVS